MGKRELIIGIGFVLLATVVYHLTAAPAPGGEGFSFSQLWSNIRRSMPDRASASASFDQAIPIATTISTLRIAGMAGSITVIGEARDDIAAHLSVRSAAQDDAQAMACAKAARLKVDVTTDTVAVDANFDRACRSVGSLTLTVPRRLTARVEGGTNLRVSAVNALRVTGGGGGAVIQHIPAGVTGELRAGTIEITDVGPLDLTLTAAQATITGVHGAARLTVRAGRCLATDLTGDVDIDERQSEIALDAPRSAVRIAGTGGHVKIGAPQGEVHVDVRLAGISASLTRSTSLTLSTTDGGIDLSLADGLGLDLDATATDGDIIAHDWQLAPVRSDRSAHLAHAWGKTALVSLRVSRGDITIRKVGR